MKRRKYLIKIWEKTKKRDKRLKILLKTLLAANICPKSVEKKAWIRPICFQWAYLLCPRRWGRRTRWAVRSALCSTSATPLNLLSPDLSNDGRERLVRMVTGVMLVVQLAGMPSQASQCRQKDNGTTENPKTSRKKSRNSSTSKPKQSRNYYARSVGPIGPIWPYMFSL